MYFTMIFQNPTLILLAMYRIIGVQSETCVLKPQDVEKLPITVYINGGTHLDAVWLSRYCSWKSSGFPYDTYAPVSVRVGAEITCNGDKCTCPNESDAQADCAVTFKHVCAAAELGHTEYKNLLHICCTEMVNPHTKKPKGFDTCVGEHPQLKEKIDACLAKTGDKSPREIALKNAKKVIDKGVNLEENREPFFFFDGNFSKCINNNAYDMWLETICSMLKVNLAKTIQGCKECMGW